jgi:hypothetical protein
MGTALNLVVDLRELNELAGRDMQDGDIAERVARMINDARADLVTLHEVVSAVIAEGERDPDGELAGILFSESATSILRSFGRMQGAADGVLRAEKDRGNGSVTTIMPFSWRRESL